MPVYVTWKRRQYRKISLFLYCKCIHTNECQPVYWRDKEQDIHKFNNPAKYFPVHHCLLNISAMIIGSIFCPLQRLSSKTLCNSSILSLQNENKWSVFNQATEEQGPELKKITILFYSIFIPAFEAAQDEQIRGMTEAFYLLADLNLWGHSFSGSQVMTSCRQQGLSMQWS